MTLCLSTVAGGWLLESDPSWLKRRTRPLIGDRACKAKIGIFIPTKYVQSQDRSTTLKEVLVVTRASVV